MSDSVRLTDPVVEEHYTARPCETDAQPFIHRAGRWCSYRRPLISLVVITGTLYTLLALAQNAHLFSYGFDLGVYYEALRGYAHFGLPLVALKGQHYNLLGDHFEPMLALLVPTYWIWPDPDVLLVDQAVLVALSVIPVWMFTERRFGAAPGVARLTTTRLVATYALAWEIQSLVGFDFHSLAFAVPILAVAIERADAGKWRIATISIVSLLLVKEDLSLVVAAFGVYAFLRGRRRLGLFLVAIGLAAFGLLVDVVIPAFAAGVYPHWSYGELGPGPWPALRYVVLHPIATLRVMVSPTAKVGLLAWVFVPGALLSLLSPITILAVPILLERVLSQRPDVWSTAFQYSAPLAPIVGMAVIDGLWRATRRDVQTARQDVAAVTESRHSKSVGRRLRLFPAGDGTAIAAVGLSMVALVISVHFSLSLLVAKDFQLFRPDPSVTALDAAEGIMPSGVTVATSNNLVPRMLNRYNPMVLTEDSVCGAWVMAWTGLPEYPYITQDQLLRQLTTMEDHEWVVLFKRDNIELLHRLGSGDGTYRCNRKDPLLAPD